MAKFSVSYTFRARASDIIEAESMEEAKALIEAKVERDDFDPGVEDIDDVDFGVHLMHPVTRDGREVWSTYIRSGDVRGHLSALATAPLFAQEAAGVPAVA